MKKTMQMISAFQLKGLAALSIITKGLCKARILTWQKLIQESFLGKGTWPNKDYSTRKREVRDRDICHLSLHYNMMIKLH